MLNIFFLTEVNNEILGKIVYNKILLSRFRLTNLCWIVVAFLFFLKNSTFNLQACATQTSFSSTSSTFSCVKGQHVFSKLERGILKRTLFQRTSSHILWYIREYTTCHWKIQTFQGNLGRVQFWLSTQQLYIDDFIWCFSWIAFLLSRIFELICKVLSNSALEL